MTPSQIRDAVCTLQAQGQSLRQISRALQLSRNTVRRILRQPAPATAGEVEWQRLGITLGTLHSAFTRAQGNVVRMGQLLGAEYERDFPYSTLTRWVRAAGLRTPPQRAGEYTFGPGEEMQHDTSPHRVRIGEQTVTAQCAGLVLAYSRRLFVQYYPRYTRFEAKQFLLEAARFMAGMCPVCVIDNTSVMLAAGAGADAVIAPEMAAFARTLGFAFQAHAVGHADRKGRIERNFFFVETNFLPGRSFRDFADLNRQALAWCQTVANATPKRVLGMTPEAAYVLEQSYLQPLPAVLPPVYEVVERVVDLSGYVSLETNRYSTPERLVGQTVSVYKYPAQVQIHHHGTVVATHPRLLAQRDGRSTDPAHHPTPARASRTPGLAAQLRPDSPELDAYARALQQRGRGRGVRALRRLLELQRTYPAVAFLAAIRQAAHFGLYDLGRLEKLILQQVAGNFFALNPDPDDDA
jgi:transposase